MKRTLSLMLVLLLVCSVCGCHYSDSGDILEPVEFFYPRRSTGFIYGSAEGVITSELREASGHVNDLNYLLAMYLRGPQDADLRTPFPTGCRPEKIYAEDGTLYIRLSAEFAAVENAELTLACAALAKTCFSLTAYDRVCIDSESEDKSVHMTLDAGSLLFSDHSAFKSSATE